MAGMNGISDFQKDLERVFGGANLKKVVALVETIKKGTTSGIRQLEGLKNQASKVDVPSTEVIEEWEDSGGLKVTESIESLRKLLSKIVTEYEDACQDFEFSDEDEDEDEDED